MSSTNARFIGLAVYPTWLVVRSHVPIETDPTNVFNLQKSDENTRTSADKSVVVTGDDTEISASSSDEVTVNVDDKSKIAVSQSYAP